MAEVTRQPELEFDWSTPAFPDEQQFAQDAGGGIGWGDKTSNWIANLSKFMTGNQGKNLGAISAAGNFATALGSSSDPRLRALAIQELGNKLAGGNLVGNMLAKNPASTNTAPAVKVTPAPLAVKPQEFVAGPPAPAATQSRLESTAGEPPGLMATPVLGEPAVNPQKGVVAGGGVAPTGKPTTTPAAYPTILGDQMAGITTSAQNMSTVDPTQTALLSAILGPDAALKVTQQGITNNQAQQRLGIDAGNAETNRITANATLQDHMNRSAQWTEGAPDRQVAREYHQAQTQDLIDKRDPKMVEKLTLAKLRGEHSYHLEQVRQFAANSPLANAPIDSDVAEILGVNKKDLAGMTHKDLYSHLGAKGYHELTETITKYKMEKEKGKIDKLKENNIHIGNLAKVAKSLEDINKEDNKAIEDIRTRYFEPFTYQKDPKTGVLISVPMTPQEINNRELISGGKSKVMTPEIKRDLEMTQRRVEMNKKWHLSVIEEIAKKDNPWATPGSYTPAPTTVDPEKLPVQQIVVNNGRTFKKIDGKWYEQTAPKASPKPPEEPPKEPPKVIKDSVPVYQPPKIKAAAEKRAEMEKQRIEDRKKAAERRIEDAKRLKQKAEEARKANKGLWPE